MKFGERETMGMHESIHEITAHCLNDGFNVTFQFMKTFSGKIILRGIFTFFIKNFF